VARRPWLVVSIVTLLAAAAPRGLTPATPAVPAESDVLVTVAEVASDRATIWVRAEGGGTTRVRYGSEPTGLTPASPGGVKTATLAPDPRRDHTAHAVLTGLAPATRYVFEALHGGAAVAGTFATAPRETDDVRARLLWSGDLGGGGHCRDVEDGYPIFSAMRRRRADFFLFLGDTIYADHPCGRPGRRPGAGDVAATSIAQFHAKHRDNRRDHAVQRFLRSTPVYAVWDDHEVRNNFAARFDPRAPTGLRAFRDYWAIDGPPGEPDRLYRRVRWGRHVEAFILDTRQYRSANRDEDGPAKSMLGPVQRAWLLDGLAASDATWKVVVTSVPLGMFTGGSVSDSWSSANALGFPRRGTGFVHERDLILSWLFERGVRNVVFLSGDAHHAELIRHEPVPGSVVHEFVAGPLSARRGFPRFLDRSLGSRSLGALGLANNFGELDADGASLTVRVFDTSGSVRVTTRLVPDRGATTVARAPVPLR
jgi:alkaline phosphatase D